MVRPFVKSTKQAAGTVVFAAASPDVADASGAYINNCFPCNPDPSVADTEARRKLWDDTVDSLASRL